MKYLASPGFAALAASAALLAGCASQSGISKSAGVSAPSALQATITPSYESAAVRQQLADLGLVQPLSDYWSAHVARNWAVRYRMETFQRPVEEQFYVAYYQPAWQLLDLRIETVDVSDAPERVRVNMQARFRNPQRQEQVRNTFVQDLWTKDNGQWKHVNSDPMLNGLKPVK